MGSLESGLSKRTALRIPVSLVVRCELSGMPSIMGKVANLSTAGLFMRTATPIGMRERVGMEFMIPNTLNSLQVVGESVWSRASPYMGERIHGVGIKFVDLREPYLSLIRDYSLRRLADENVVRSVGIEQIMRDIRNLPPQDRLKAYHILIKRGNALLKN